MTNLCWSPAPPVLEFEYQKETPSIGAAHALPFKEITNMVPFEDKLRALAERKHAADWPACQRLQEEVEASLVPLIRCATRRGVGLPQLVQWVRTTLSRLGERERTPAALARRLCANLLTQYEVGPRQVVSSSDTIAIA
jgi:hypothetical protein